MKTDTRNRYGSISRCFHWSMAACYLFMLGTVVAWTFDGKLKGQLMGMHRTVGFVLAGLIVLRLVWALLQMSRRPKNNLAARAGHVALYVLMFAVPALAIARQIGRAQGDKFLVGLGNQWHGELGWVLFVLVAGHILMTIIHQVRGEPILSRMWG